MKIVVTNSTDNQHCNCQFCNKKIAEITIDAMVPSAEECYENGNVPIPNFGWFCSQACASAYEAKYDIEFARTKAGIIDYYAVS